MPDLAHSRVFISYSREHADLVAPLVQLLRLENSEIFLDQDSVEPGTRWRDVLEDRVRSANRVVLFWCCHASGSTWVDAEVGWAIEERIAIVPVLLCGEQLPAAVAEFQWIDFRAASHDCTRHGSGVSGEPKQGPLRDAPVEEATLPRPAEPHPEPDPQRPTPTLRSPEPIDEHEIPMSSVRRGSARLKWTAALLVVVAATLALWLSPRPDTGAWLPVVVTGLLVGIAAALVAAGALLLAVRRRRQESLRDHLIRSDQASGDPLTRQVPVQMEPRETGWVGGPSGREDPPIDPSRLRYRSPDARPQAARDEAEVLARRIVERLREAQEEGVGTPAKEGSVT